MLLTSDIMTQGIPPIPNENDPVYTKTPVSARYEASPLNCFTNCNENDKPTRKHPIHVPVAEI
jgi:hypothetical protein